MPSHCCPEIGALNPKLRGFAGPGAKRQDVIENPIKSAVKLVDSSIARKCGSPKAPRCARGW